MEKITITTWRGHEIDLIKGPHPDQIEIEDIAHSLAMQCRFTGHLNRFYSVAEHSLLVAAHAPILYRLYFLLHNGDEFLTGDMSYPMKCLIFGVDYKSNPEYKKISGRFMKAIIEKFGLKYEAYLNLEKTIKEVDNLVYKWETKILRGHNAIRTPKFAEDEPLHGSVFGMTAEEAEWSFLQEFNKLHV